MPHQCTACGQAFPDGSKEMLSGCPNCGGNKFQYFAGEIPQDPPDTEPPESDRQGVSGRVGKAARSVRDFVERDTDDTQAGPRSVRDGTTRPPSRSGDGVRTEERADRVSSNRRPESPTAMAGDEDSEQSSSGEPDTTDSLPAEAEAQTEARSDVVDEESLPEEVEGEVVATPSGERPDMATLREELNDQFESIRIVDKGQYELNLMELYDREEYIIALQENGRYVIEVPDAWREGDNS